MPKQKRMRKALRKDVNSQEKMKEMEKAEGKRGEESTAEQESSKRTHGENQKKWGKIILLIIIIFIFLGQ